MSGMETLVGTVFEQWHTDNACHMSQDDAWELFVAWLITRNDDTTLDTLRSGTVDGANDGGMDTILTLLEGAVLPIDHSVIEDPSAARKMSEGLDLTLHVIQAKNNRTMSQRSISAIHSVLPLALDLSRDLGELSAELNDHALEQLSIFRSAYKNLLSRRPKVTVKVTIASRGDSAKAPENVVSRAERLRDDCSRTVPSADVIVALAGADELWHMYDQRPQETLELHCEELLTDSGSYVALATLPSYMRLITDASLNLRRHLFDANVRDYQGQVAVNKEITASLSDSHGPEFWWLNNGVTLLCDEAHGAGKTLALRNIQIVNGLQTSHTLALWSKDSQASTAASTPSLQDDRKILVRVIVASDDAVRDKIIRATNRQTPVPDASLRATDEVQRRIEAFFSAKGLFYDRRKGYYRNLGKDPAKIIGIPYLGQAMYAIAYGKPEVARGKPNSLLAEDARYLQAFDAKANIEIFYWAATVLRAVDEHLQSAASQMKYPERRYLAPFVAFALVCQVLSKQPTHWQDVKTLALSDRHFTAEELEQAAAVVKSGLDAFTARNATSASDATKRQPLTQYLVTLLVSQSSEEPMV